MRSFLTLALASFSLTLASALTVGCGGGVETTPGGGGSGGTSGSVSTGTVVEDTGPGSSVSSTTSTSATSSTSVTNGASSSSSGGFTPTCTASTGTVLAANQLFLGDKTFDGTTDANAWKLFGFNVDGKVSDASSTDLCKPVSGSSAASVYPDGNNGNDNSFGKNIVPVIEGVAADFSSSVNDQIASGSFTIMVELESLGADPDQATLSAKLYGGATLGSAPKFDGTDCWPVVPELLSNPSDIQSSTIVFSQGSLAGDVWTSGVIPKLALSFNSQVGVISLTIHQAQMSLKLDADHKGGTLGQIGGVLDTEEFLKQIQTAIAGAAGAFACHLADNQIRQASDIMNDGSEDPTKTCNGISIGLGFTMKEVQLGGVAPPSQPGSATCP